MRRPAKAGPSSATPPPTSLSPAGWSYRYIYIYIYIYYIYVYIYIYRNFFKKLIWSLPIRSQRHGVESVSEYTRLRTNDMHPEISGNERECNQNK